MNRLISGRFTYGTAEAIGLGSAIWLMPLPFEVLQTAGDSVCYGQRVH